MRILTNIQCLMNIRIIGSKVTLLMNQSEFVFNSFLNNQLGFINNYKP